MYFVDRSKIEQTLIYMEQVLDELKKASHSSFADRLALERMVHIAIESILDVGNMMIDGFIMRDPGSYEDIIDILVDEKVLMQEEEDAYKSFIGLRKMLVNEYASVDHASLSVTLEKSIRSIKKFEERILQYLDNELGVANTFLNE